MRYWYCALALTSAAFAQTSTSVTDSSVPGLDGSTQGQVYRSSKTATSNSRIEYAPSVNGQLAPRESIEEKVIRQDANGRVVERYVRRFDATGNPGPLEKTVVEEKKAGNTTTVTSTVYRGDLNGNLIPAERSQAQSIAQGNTVNTSIVVERSGLDGQMSPIEKVQQTTVQNSKESQQQTTTRMRRDANGNYYEAVREVKETTAGSNGTVENRAQYVDGALAEQSVARTVSAADGSSTTTVDVYATQQPGLTADIGGKLALKEQQQIVKQVDGRNVTETVTSRKPNVSDPNRLGPAQTLSKSVCKGGCQP